MRIEIPGKITFSRTYNIPPIQVDLPLRTHGRTFWQWMMTAIFLSGSLFVLVMWLGMSLGLGKGDPPPPIGFLGGVALVSLKLVLILPQRLLGLVGLALSGPALILDAQGLTDRRTGISFPWKSVASARSVDLPMDSGIRLALRSPVPPRRWLFDRGGGKVLGIRRPDEYILRIVCLNVSHHVLQETVFALVRSNGGTVKT